MDRNVNLKTVLVGEDAIVVGLGNSAFQDITYRANLYPKRKASELTDAEQKVLFSQLNLWFRKESG